MEPPNTLVMVGQRAVGTVRGMATKWWTLLVVCLATFMLLLDVTIVNVALPDIQKDLGSSFEDLQWVVDAYALALAALLLASGSLGDLLGRKNIFVAGLVIFSSASLACGLSGATTGFAVAVGPVVGGALTDAFGWEWIFLVNVPVGLITLAITLMRTRNSERDPSARIDWAGLVTFSTGLFCLVFA